MFIADVSVEAILFFVECLLVWLIQLVDLRHKQSFLLIVEHFVEDPAIDDLVDLVFLRKRVEVVFFDVGELILEDAL